MNRNFSLAFILFFITQCVISGSAQSSLSQDRLAEERKLSTRELTDNSFKTARIVNEELWYVEESDGTKPTLIHRMSEDKTVKSVYNLRSFGDPYSQIPRWRIQGDYFYTVTLFPGSNRLGYAIMRFRIKDLKPPPTEEEIKRVNGLISSPSSSLLNLKPLNNTYALQYENLDTLRGWDEPVWYDFLIGDNEKCTLVIITQGNLTVWEVDSRNNWEFTSIEDRRQNPPSGPPGKWKQLAAIRAPFSARFGADLQDGKLTLMTETGDLWQADGKFSFQRSGEAATPLSMEVMKAGVEPMLIEDTSAHQTWYAHYQKNGANRQLNLRLLKGAETKSNDRISAVLKTIQSLK